MGFEGTDIPRAMIALQDLLAKSEQRHRKATQHIAFTNQMGQFLAGVMEIAAETTMEQQVRIGELTSALMEERMDHAETANMLQQMYSAKRNVEGDLDAVKRAMGVLNG
jgi:hypothetical protein